MTEHLPECCVGKDGCNAEPCQRCHACCICEQLRACEQRMDDRWEKFSRDQFNEGYSAGYEKAVADAQHLLEKHMDSIGWVALAKMKPDD